CVQPCRPRPWVAHGGQAQVAGPARHIMVHSKSACQLHRPNRSAWAGPSWAAPAGCSVLVFLMILRAEVSNTNNSSACWVPATSPIFDGPDRQPWTYAWSPTAPWTHTLNTGYKNTTGPQAP